MIWLLPFALATLAAWRWDGARWLWPEPLWWLLGLGASHLLLRWLIGRRLPLRARPALPLGLGLGWLVLGFVSPTPPPLLRASATVDRPDILLITVEGARADFLPFGEARSPNLDDLANQGLRFTAARTPAPNGPAVVSLLTGLDPWKHGLLDAGRASTKATVVPDLQAAGYATGAFVSTRALDAAAGLLSGFVHIDDRWGFRARAGWLPLIGDPHPPPQRRTRSGAATVRRALTWLRGEAGPRFVWGHLIGARAPYNPPESFAPSGEALAAARELDQRQPVARSELGSVLRGMSTPRPAERRLRFQGELEATDMLIGLLVEAIGDDAVVVVAGTHGESLGEQGYWFNHGARLGEASLRVPLVLRWPGVVAPAVNEGAVSIMGVAALLRQVATGGAPQGPLFAGADPGPIFAYTTGQESHRTMASRDGTAWVRGPMAAAWVPGGALIAARDGGVSWFDLEADPQQERPMAVPVGLEGLAAEVAGRARQDLPALSAEQAELREALGYAD
jgi:arylsulfatase A-like enzyme